MVKDVELLAEVPLFALMTPRERVTLVEILEIVRYGRGEVIFAQGSDGDTMYIVRRGGVEIFVEDLHGRRTVLGVGRRGDFFGEISLLDGGSRTASVMATEPTELWALDRDDLLELITRHPRSALHLLSVMGRRLRSTDELLRTQVTRNANQEEQARLSFGRRLASGLLAAAGSWYVIVPLLILAGWFLGIHRADVPTQLPIVTVPLLFRALFLVLLALNFLILFALRSLANKERLKADLDYQANLKSELELIKIAKTVHATQEDLVALQDLMRRARDLDAPAPAPKK